MSFCDCLIIGAVGAVVGALIVIVLLVVVVKLLGKYWGLD